MLMSLKMHHLTFWADASLAEAGWGFFSIVVWHHGQIHLFWVWNSVAVLYRPNKSSDGTLPVCRSPWATAMTTSTMWPKRKPNRAQNQNLAGYWQIKWCMKKSFSCANEARGRADGAPDYFQMMSYGCCSQFMVTSSQSGVKTCFCYVTAFY